MTENQLIRMYKRDMEIIEEKYGKDQEDVRSDKLTIELLEEHMQYREIGTVEECRVAVEKQRAKKPLSKTHCKDGDHPLSQDIGRCPTCNGIVAEDMLWCDDCGQKLNWSETP